MVSYCLRPPPFWWHMDSRSPRHYRCRKRPPPVLTSSIFLFRGPPCSPSYFAATERTDDDNSRRLLSRGSSHSVQQRSRTRPSSPIGRPSAWRWRQRRPHRRGSKILWTFPPLLLNTMKFLFRVGVCSLVALVAHCRLSR